MYVTLLKGYHNIYTNTAQHAYSTLYKNKNWLSVYVDDWTKLLVYDVPMDGKMLSWILLHNICTHSIRIIQRVQIK